MKTAWLKLSAIGLVSALTASACKITTSDGEDGGTGGGSNSTGGKSSTGGTTSTGGSKATGGTSTGGIAGTGGSKATGGSTSTGGSKATGGATSALGCSNKGDASTPAGSCVFPDESLADPVIGKCLTCISKATTCCAEVRNCFGTDPDNQCGYGGLEKDQTEFLCYQDCLVVKGTARGGQYEEADTDACANDCATPACGAPPVGDETNALIACMHTNCEDECFLDPAM